MVALRRAIQVGTVLACALTAHTLWNLRHLRSLENAPPPAPISDAVTVIIPARNEEKHVARTLQSVISQREVPALSVVVLNDGSTDRTPHEVSSVATEKVLLINEADQHPPAGWLGKPWALARAVPHATGSVLVFVDADVTLTPHAIASAVHTLREQGLDMVAPYPRQIALTPLARLVQPLIPWSWATTVPLAWARTAQWASMSAANGQFLIVDTAAYQAVGGHGAVAGEVLEDIALMRAFRRSGFSAETMNGSEVSECTMYETNEQVVEGYTKSLWDAFGGVAGTTAVTTVLTLSYVVAPLGVLHRTTRTWGLVAYGAGILGRVVVGRTMKDRIWPDALAQPLSITAFAALEIASWTRRVRGTAQWKGRPVTAAPSESPR